MSKIKNHYVYSENREELDRLQQEYEMLGRYCTREVDTLIVHALPRGARNRKPKDQKRGGSKRRY